MAKVILSLRAGHSRRVMPADYLGMMGTVPRFSLFVSTLTSCETENTQTVRKQMRQLHLGKFLQH